MNAVRRRVHWLRQHLDDVPRQLKHGAALVVSAIKYTTDPEQNSVIPSLVLFYGLCICNGWYNGFIVTAPTQILEDPLSKLQYQVFVWVTFIAPMFTLVGMCLRGKWAWTGALMQLAGDIGVCGVLWTFITAVINTQYWGQGNFAGTWVLSSAVGAVIFVIRDVRRLLDKNRWEDHG